ncbi:UUP1 family membrane protein [bacterium]|nr:UUP1 family membrane protein [bacterium]
MNAWTVKCWALALILAGLGLCLYKSQVLGLPLAANETADGWTVQAKLRFQGNGGPAKLSLQIPDLTPGFVALDEDFIASGFGLTVDEDVDQRWARWAVRRARGEQTVYYRMAVARSALDSEWSLVPSFKQVPVYPEPLGTAVREVIKSVRR